MIIINLAFSIIVGVICGFAFAGIAAMLGFSETLQFIVFVVFGIFFGVRIFDAASVM